MPTPMPPEEITSVPPFRIVVPLVRPPLSAVAVPPDEITVAFALPPEEMSCASAK